MKYMLLVYMAEGVMTETERSDCMRDSTALCHERAGHIATAWAHYREAVRLAKQANDDVSREAAHDGYLIVNLDAAGAIVGVQLLAASEVPSALWRNHPDRGALPDDIARTIDAWVDARPPRAQTGLMREM